MLHCKTCGRSLIGSERKGFVYYRCSNIPCPTTSVREHAVEAAISELLATIWLNERDSLTIEAELGEYDRNRTAVQEARRVSLTEALSAATARMTRLTDLLLDGKIDAAAHDAKRAELILERQDLERDLAAVDGGTRELVRRTRQIVELAQSAENIYQAADDERKRRLLETVLSDCMVTGNTPEFSLLEPFATFAQRHSEQMCSPDWYTARTFPLDELLRWSTQMPENLGNILDNKGLTGEVEEAA